MNFLTREQFHRLAEVGASVPVYRILPADLETPVSVYLKLRGRGASFLLESVERGEQVGRYSFIGADPQTQVVARGRSVTIYNGDQPHTQTLAAGQDPLHVLQAEMSRYAPPAPPEQVAPGLPYFLGGAVGYLGYDMVRFWERLPEDSADLLGLPDMHMLIADALVAFDHAANRLLLLINTLARPTADLDTVYNQAVARLDALEARLHAPLPDQPAPSGASNGELVSSVARSDLEAQVCQAQEYIAAGDIFQVVLSQRLARSTAAEPFAIYRALRRLNPSPYMFFFDLAGSSDAAPFYLIGSSPEMHCRLHGRIATVCPIAGTRRRGHNEAEDRALEAELLADPKERAEHVMLVDLGRNDLGRVCEYGSVQPQTLLSVERYSHVIHLVSRVSGTLRSGMDAGDLIRATFPAGTVSGAPKVRAMEIIEELEKLRRGVYAGAVGYWGFNGNADTCIAIRTIIMRGQTAFLQAGAGIVADSDPAREWEESLYKARALSVAIDMAEAGQ